MTKASERKRGPRLAGQKSRASTAFDSYAASYEEALAQGLSVSGECSEFFARGRVAWLAGSLRRTKERPALLMDFGCGQGSTVPLLLELIRAEAVIGVDISQGLLDIAKQTCHSERAMFCCFDDYTPAGNVDLVYCNGVFHHIRPPDRQIAVDYIYRSLRPGGLFALWENNPWNPGTRYVMSRIPFDRDAITLSAPETRRLLCSCGFEILQTDFLFIFPKVLGWLRFLEPALSRFPLGAQYQVLCRKPAG